MAIPLPLYWKLETRREVGLWRLKAIGIDQQNTNQTESLKESGCWRAALSKLTDAEAVLEINRIV
jgi:hypothetical protein